MRCGCRDKAWVAKLVWLGCLLVMAMPIQAEDLLEVYRKALQNDPQILGAGHVHSAAGELIKEARGRMLPQLGLDYSYSRTDQEIKSSDDPFFYPLGRVDFPTTDYSLTLTQPLVDWSLYLGYSQAKVIAQRADAEFASEQQDKKKH